MSILNFCLESLGSEKITLRIMLGSIPHQKLCFYHLPTRGRARIKLGDDWYVSNISIIFYCSMLLYYLFWMLMGLFIHFYIIFGTNLLTQGPVQIAVFFISVFRRKGISNGIQTEWNLRESYFWNKRDPGDLEWTSSNQQGGHKAGGVPTRMGTPSTLVGPSWLHRPTSSSYIYSYTPKTSRSTTKPYFHRRNLLYPRDPILGPFPELRWRGHRSQRASISTP